MSSSPASKFPPPRLILSYVLDWVVIIIIAVVGAAISRAQPNHRPFSLVDPSISFPYVDDAKVSNVVLFVVSIIAPAIIIAFVSLVFVPGPSGQKLSLSSHSLKRKLWEWNAAWMGLTLGLAITAVFTNGLKLVTGNPRPDLLSRCNPNLLDISSHLLGGINDQVGEGTLVSWTICQQSDAGTLADGFQSFPSGHASFGFAGLFYLALFLCSKFAVRIPYLPHGFPTYPSISPSVYSANANGHSESGDSATSSKEFQTIAKSRDSLRGHHNGAAAPPTYLVVLPLIPICVATYISATRFTDFRHRPWDIISGALLGILFSWLSFRMYQPPVRRGDGWAWPSRSASRAFGISIGSSGYVESDLRRKKSDDVESGQANLRNGRHPFSADSENGRPVQQGI